MAIEPATDHHPTEDNPSSSDKPVNGTANHDNLASNTTSTLHDSVHHAKHAAEHVAESILGANPIIGLDAKEILSAIQRLLNLALGKPEVIVKKEFQLLTELGRILSGQSEVQPDKKDRRFAHEIWQKNKFYKTLMQSYLAWRKSLHEIIEESDASDTDKERAQFALSLFTEAVAPTNTLIGNPGAVKNAIDTKGMSLVKGFMHMIDDWRHNNGMPKQVDDRKFTLGKNIASSPGAVIYRNPLLEVIQYECQQTQAYEKPLLIIPPQINKFYIVDISQQKSFIEYTAQRGIQPFVISWRNPTAAQRDWNLEAYVKACKDAIEVICEITGSPDVNIMAACVGGYTAASLIGHLEASGEKRVNTATYLVTVLDSQAPTLMGLFASNSTIQAAINRSRHHGVLEGKDMARVFAWLRPNDLIWGYFANNYLMGNEPPAFDILYWNADTTRLPAEFHADILNLFMENALAHKGSLNLLGTPIDMQSVEVESFIVAGITDHITPWKACYQTRDIIGGKKQFILSSSGHIQSIVNPPANPKAKFYINDDLSQDADTWLVNAELRQGSWWDYWYDWMQTKSGGQKDKPKALGNENYPPKEPAPGRYVHQC